jgi:predicted DNA-binding transcriptional regulator AlpA
MNQLPASAVSPSRPLTFSLPESGELLLTISQVADILGQSESQTWADAKKPDFPPLIRRGSRCTRVKASDLRAYIASLESKPAKTMPAQRSRASRPEVMA